MTQVTPLEISKRHAVLQDIHDGRSNTKISEGFNLKTVQKIQSELTEFSGDFKCMFSRKLHSHRSDMKRTPEFLGEIQVMIDNDPKQVNQVYNQGHVSVSVYHSASSA